jgi:hypothetical protein
MSKTMPMVERVEIRIKNTFIPNVSIRESNCWDSMYMAPFTDSARLLSLRGIVFSGLCILNTSGIIRESREYVSRSN